jgi:hypothetical protein
MHGRRIDAKNCRRTLHKRRITCTKSHVGVQKVLGTVFRRQKQLFKSHSRMQKLARRM